ncbi:MAG: glycoside hydrolase family 3 C-terminal domain-containing protein [Deltaproteobacteria bacterium]|nr:glycoside hydrolase family 3 C-terminal domain-containing protein [Deltaproteobacteria bacterium]MBN2674024.1 glycoside hydrolase family 3 C-terminal domain-containing protein [Deltaproteobacteria bacterium]
MLLLIVSCSHYDWTDQSAVDDDLTDSDSEPDGIRTQSAEERTVDYAERESVEKEDICEAVSYQMPFTEPYVPSDSIRELVQLDIAAMTIEQKLKQMTGTDSGGLKNDGDIFRQLDDGPAGIRGFKFRDGPRGLNLATDLYMSSGDEGYATAFPVSVARGASFDMDLEYEIGRAQGEEVLASKHHMLLAPTVNLLRHPAWGRAQETYGEDPFLLGRMGTAFTIGVQEYIPACVKHFIGNNVENDRARLASSMDDQTLREIYGRAYDMIVNDGGVACVMAAYNLIEVDNNDSEKCTESAYLLSDVLRDDFGFEGFVMSDWWAMTNGKPVAELSQGVYQAVATAGVKAGMDMELPWSLNYREVPALVQGGQIDESLVNTSVARILEQKYRFNLANLSETEPGLSQPDVGWDYGNTSIVDTNDEHLALAEEAALKSAVLLKNDDSTLPIDLDSGKTLAVLGATVEFTLTAINFAGSVNYAEDVITGDRGSSLVFNDPNRSTSPLKGIEAAANAKGLNVVFGTSADEAQDADFIVVLAGLNAMDEGEEYTGAGDRSTFALDGKLSDSPQNDLINAAASLDKPMAVVLIGGSVIDMPWLSDVDAVLMAWYPGMAGGKAIGKLLFGDASPSGRLPITWPTSWNQAPEFNPGDVVPMDYFAGYRYYEKQDETPLFPFGHGLSYSTFDYLNLEVPCSSVTQDSVVEVKVDVSNRGDMAADNVIFLFTSYPNSNDERKRVRQLKGFYRVSLDADETKQITMPLRMHDLRFYDDGEWKVETGDLEISIQRDANTVITSTLTGKVLTDSIQVVDSASN